MSEFLEKIESYGFECEAGPLNMCEDWQSLKAIASQGVQRPAAEAGE